MPSTDFVGRTTRGTALALILAVPGLVQIGHAASVLALGTTGINVLWRVETVNLSEAIFRRDLAEAARLIEQGADLNAALPIRRGWLADLDVMLTPIEAAVVGDRPNAFDLLLARGARLEPSMLPRLVCVGQRADSDAMVSRLQDMIADAPNCDDMVLPW
jgi:hypothetical protein